MKAIFIAGTDTGVGKTVVTGCLAQYLSDKGHKVITQKWIQTGCNSKVSSDIKTHLEIMGQDISQIKPYLPYVSPYIFKLPSSAHLASAAEKKRIDIKKIIKSLEFLSKRFDFVLVEGLGGAAVPINNKVLMIDLVRKLDLPVLLVVGNKLGAINHALLTLEALRLRKIKVLGLLFNNLGRENKVLEDNPRIVQAFAKEKVFGTLPYRGSQGQLYKSFRTLGDKLFKGMRI